jgi:hypothetical protein
MEIGKLYSAKKWQWLILPEKELYKKLTDAYYPGFPAIDFSVNADSIKHFSVSFSKKLDCPITFLLEKNTFLLLEEDNMFKKVLIANGTIGWIIVEDYRIGCFNEVMA